MRRSIRAKSTTVGGLLVLVAGMAGLVGCGGTEPDAPSDQTVETSQPIVFAGHYYYFFVTSLNWTSAANICIGSGTHLVTVNSASEEQFLADEEAAHGGGTWWTGLNDRVSEGMLGWESGDGSTFRNFAPGQPDNLNNQDCVYDNFTNGQWDDLNCNTAMKFICERDLPPLINDGSFSFNVSNTNNATQNVVIRRANFAPGSGLAIGTCGVPGATYTGDTMIRLFDANGNQIAFNDDACFGNFGSNLSIVTPSPFFFIHVGCFGNTSCSGVVAVKL
jgi:hypothetical protein